MSKKSHYHALFEKWHGRHKALHKKVWEKHKDALSWFADTGKQAALTSMSGLMLLSSPSGALVSTPITPPPVIARDILEPIHADSASGLQSDLRTVLPEEVRPLTADEEEKIGSILSDRFGFRVTAELDGKRLNRSYGLIGQEQHLARYPGDTMATHFDSPAHSGLSLGSKTGEPQDSEKYYSYGMAPGLGAWGYFSQSRDAVTQLDSDREKYYIATQTFLAPGFAEDTREYITFFKFRKMLVVNPDNGRAVIADIADAGPAQFTGKHLGGSPEVMRYLERYDGAARGPVLYFFVDEPSDTIPLGPRKPEVKL